MKKKSTLLAIGLVFSWYGLLAENFESQQKAFHEERRALYQERQAVVEAYSDEDPQTRREALEEWRHENSERFEDLRAMADVLSSESETRAFEAEAIAERIARLEETELAGDLPPAQREFLEKRRVLYLEWLERKKEVAELSPEDRREALRALRAESEDRYAELRELAETASAESASQPRNTGIPEEPVFPNGSSAAERDFLEKRHELYRERAELEEQYADSSPEDLRTALEEWRQERRDEFEELRSLAEAAAEN